MTYREAIAALEDAPVELNKVSAIERIVYGAFYALNENNSRTVPVIDYHVKFSRLFGYTLVMPDTELVHSANTAEGSFTTPIHTVITDLLLLIRDLIIKWDYEVMEGWEEALNKN